MQLPGSSWRLRSLLFLACGLLAACADDKPKLTDDQADSPITCEAGADCRTKWQKSLQWVEGNSHYPVDKATDDTISVGVTNGGSYPVVTVHKQVDPQDPNTYRIIFRAECQNMLGCAPTEEQMATSFTNEIGDIDPPEVAGGDADTGAQFAPDQREPGHSGVTLTGVEPDSAFAKAGLRAGDRITKFNGSPVATQAKLVDMLKAAPEGSVVPVQYARAGRIFVVYLRF